MAYSRRSYRSRSRSRLRSRKSRNRLPALIVIVLGVALLLGVLFWAARSLFSSVTTENASAEIQVYAGRTEFKLKDSDVWTLASTDQKFFEGEALRTGSNARSALSIFDTNTVFLGPETEVLINTIEEKSSGRKTVELQLLRGQIWAKVDANLFGVESKSTFAVESSRTRAIITGTVFNFSTSEVQDTLRVVKGQVQAALKDGDDTYQVDVKLGQKLVINDEVLASVAQGQEVLDVLDPEFTESEWHLTNLEIFFPQEAADIRRRIEVTAPPESVPAENPVEGLPEASDIEAPTITTPTANEAIPAAEDILKIEGTAPLEANQIVVNDFTLTRFQPGDRKWVYFAAKKYGTLLSGENTYTVYAVTRDGKKSAPASVTITYEGSDAPVTAATPTTPNPVETAVAAQAFPAPVITSPPALANDSSNYETSSAVVTIAGEVSPLTNAVEVNGFRLRRFNPGDTSFQYIANANYDNMQEGENTYVITAFGPDGKKASTTVKVFYRPVQALE